MDNEKGFNFRKALSRLILHKDHEDNHVRRNLEEFRIGRRYGFDCFEGQIPLFDRHSPRSTVNTKVQLLIGPRRMLYPIAGSGSALKRTFLAHWDNVFSDPPSQDHYQWFYADSLAQYKHHPDVPITFIASHGIARKDGHYIETFDGIKRTTDVISSVVKPYVRRHPGFKPVIMLGSCNASDSSGQNPATIAHPNAFILYVAGKAGFGAENTIKISK